MSPTPFIMYGLEDQCSVERRGGSCHVLSRAMQLLLLLPGVVMLQAWWLTWSQRGRDGSSHGYSFLIHELGLMVDDKSVPRHRTILWSSPGSHGSEETLRQDWPLSIFTEVQLCRGLPLIHCGQKTLQPVKIELTPFIFPLKIKIKLIWECANSYCHKSGGSLLRLEKWPRLVGSLYRL